MGEARDVPEFDAAMVELLMSALPLGDIRVAGEGDMASRAEALSEIAATDLEVAMISEAGGLTARWTGVDGYRQAWEDWMEPFDACSIELEEILPTPKGLLVLTRQTVTPRGTTAAIEGEAAGLLRFAGGRLDRIEFHLDRSAAFSAAGIDLPVSQDAGG